jgi:recombination associated protein RdgC
VNRYFRNVRLYRIHSQWPGSEEALSEILANAAFKPCGAFSERSGGFEPPVADAGDLLSRRISGADLLQLRVQTRVLPPAAVQEALVQRIEAFKQRTQTEPNRAEKRDLKDEVYSELLPQALLKSDRVQAIMLPKEGVLVIGSASEAVADYFLDALKRAMVTFQYAPLAFKAPPQEFIHKLFMGGSSAQFRMGRECRMRDPADSRASVNWLDFDLSDSTVRRHVTDGLKVDRLGLIFDQVCALVVDEDLVLRKVRLLGQDEMNDVPEEDPLAKHDAEFVIMAGAFQSLVGGLSAELGGFVS